MHLRAARELARTCARNPHNVHAGPVNDECYAVGYAIRKGVCGAQVMSYGRDAQGFVDHLKRAMIDMRDAC